MTISEDLIAPLRIAHGERFVMQDHDPANTFGVKLKKSKAKEMLNEGVDALADMQERLYADGRWSVLIILQAMDAAGKDSTIKHVMSGVNPQGCEVHSFKTPSSEELAHDFLWRTTCRLPRRGHIGIFNRSYYEEVLAVRVHESFLDAQNLPMRPKGNKLWAERFTSIRNFEKHMARNGTLVLKFFLHVSKDEQKQRQLSRIDDPAKNWKFNARDVTERGYWDEYMHAYEQAIRETATPDAPWYVIPADDKWFMRVAVMHAISAEMRNLNLAFPELDPEAKGKLAEARAALLES